MSYRTSLALGMAAGLVAAVPTTAGAEVSRPSASRADPTSAEVTDEGIAPAGPSAPISAEELAATTTDGPGPLDDTGTPFVPSPADDLPVPEVAAQPTAGGRAVAAGACQGAKYEPRGGSLIPPAGGWLVYWDAPGPGYEVRGMRGIECLGDRGNYHVRYADTKRYTAANATHGRRVVTKSGLVYEGCLKQDANDRFWCDFSSNRSKPSRLAPSRSSQYFWTVLRSWSSHTAKTTGACAADIVGVWVGASDLQDVAIDCVEAGPYRPQ